MSTAIAKNLQVGADSTATNNFTIFQPATPDGTLRIGNGNTGITSSLLTLTSAGNLGVGTSNPSYKLHVIGQGFATTGWALTNDGSTFTPAGSSAIPNYGLGAPGSNFVSLVGFGGLSYYTNQLERMRIDQSGNVGIATTTTGLRLTVFTSNANSTDGLLIRGGATTSNVLIRPAMTAGANNGIVQTGDSGIIFDKNAENTGAFVIAPWASGTSGIRMDSSGNVGIGTSSPAAKLDILTAASTNFLVGFGANLDNYYTAGGSGVHVFRNGLTERARITSGGLATFFVTNNDGLQVASNATAGTSFANFVGRHSALSTVSPGTISFVVWNNGNVVNTNNSYGAISDIKLKENITDATPKLEKLQQVRVVNFNMIGDDQKQIGVIAQELEQIFPGMINEAPDKDDEGNDLGTTTKSVKYSVFVPMLIKAIQEQQAMIVQLQADVAALKGAV